MKQTVKVSIATVAFILDEDAYKLLNGYIENLRKHFKGKEEGEEIIADIEFRLSELLQMRLSHPEAAVSLDDAIEITNIMGNPSDFVGELDAEEVEYTANSELGKEPLPMGKRRLFRDKEQHIVGGVFSGLGHYFRFDPVIFRIVYVLMLVLAAWLGGNFFGGLVACYLVLWMIIPRAITFDDKLRMRGSNPSIVDIEERKQELRNQPYRGSILVSALVGVFKVFLAIVGIFFLINLIVICITFVFLNYDTEYLYLTNYLTFAGENTFLNKIALFSIFALPLVAIVNLIAKAFFNSPFKKHNMVLLVLGIGIWLSSVVYMGLKATYYADSMMEKKHIEIDPKIDTLRISIGTKEDVKVFVQPDVRSKEVNLNVGRGTPTRVVNRSIKTGLVYRDLNGERQLTMCPPITLRRTKDLDHIQVNLVTRSYGRTRELATIRALENMMDYTLQDSLLTVHPVWYSESKPWKADSYEVEVLVPEDKELLPADGENIAGHKIVFKKSGYNYIK